jgi:antitoxin component YwqK of YwqJK toxin-antitoxin module
MHWMLKFRQKIILIFALVLVVSGLLIQVFNVRIIGRLSADLKLSPGGFTYKDSPFTGIVYEATSAMTLKSIAFLWKGLLHGPEIHWHAGGQRWIQRQYSMGKEHGVQKSWFPTGKVMSIKQYDQGIRNGDFIDWHPNGQLEQFIRYNNGIEVAAKSWTSKGKPFYNYTWRNGERIGLQGDRYCSIKR